MSHRLIYNPQLDLFELFDSIKNPVAIVNLFLKSLHTRQLSVCTARSYGFDLLMLFNWLENGNLQLENITVNELLQFIESQQKINLSPKTINRRLAVVSIFYRFNFGTEVPLSTHLPISNSSSFKSSSKEQILGLHNRNKNISRKLKVKVPKRFIEPLEPSEVKAFLHSIRRYRDLAIVYLMLLCGLRSMEIRALKWKDINTFENKFKVNGKGNKERILPLPDAVREVLEKYRLIEYPKNSSSDLVFVCLQGARRGEAIKQSGIRSLFRYKRKISKVQRANPHRFRHTCGADLAKQKMDVLRIQKILGHEHFSTSLQYINLSMDDLNNEYLNVVKNIENRYGTNHSI